MIEMQESTEGISFKVFVQPRSSRNMVTGIHADALKVKLTAPPVDGAANRMCVKFLARCLGVSKSSLEIVSGHTSRTKQILWRHGDGSVTPSERAAMKRRIGDLTGQTKK